MESTDSNIEEQQVTCDNSAVIEESQQAEGESVNDENQNKENPSADLIAETCKEEYMRLINTYDNIYNKVNILLVVCMAVFIAQAESFNGRNIIYSIMKTNSESTVIYLIVELCVSIGALGLILCATVLLCFLLKSKTIPVLNCFDLRNQRVYEGDVNKAATYLIGVYTDIMKEMNFIIEGKQKKYDLSVILVVISVVLFVIRKIM